MRFSGDKNSDKTYTVPVDYPVSKWSECGGILSAVSALNRTALLYIYFIDEVFCVQSLIVTSPINASCMFTSLDCVTQLSAVIDDERRVLLYKRFVLCLIYESKFYAE